MYIWGWHTQFLNKFRLATLSIFLTSCYFAIIYDAYHPSFQLECKSLCCPYSKLWKLCFTGEKSCRYFAWRLMIIIIVIKKLFLLNGFFNPVFSALQEIFRTLDFLLLYLPLLQSRAVHFNVHCCSADSERCRDCLF